MDQPDDLLLPGAVSAAVRAFAESPLAGAVYGEGYCIDRAGRVTGRFPATEPFNLWRLAWVCDSILQQSVFFRRSAVEEVGWLRETLHWSMDWDLLVRLGKRFGLRYVPEYLGCLREYGETKTASGGGGGSGNCGRRCVGRRVRGGLRAAGITGWIRMTRFGAERCGGWARSGWRRGCSNFAAGRSIVWRCTRRVTIPAAGPAAGCTGCCLEERGNSW